VGRRRQPRRARCPGSLARALRSGSPRSPTLRACGTARRGPGLGGLTRPGEVASGGHDHGRSASRVAGLTPSRSRSFSTVPAHKEDAFAGMREARRLDRPQALRYGLDRREADRSSGGCGGGRGRGASRSRAKPGFLAGVRRETAQMAVMTGTRSGEDPRRIRHTVSGPSREDARQGGQIRGRSRTTARDPGSPRGAAEGSTARARRSADEGGMASDARIDLPQVRGTAVPRDTAPLRTDRSRWSACRGPKPSHNP
jgi:hypothetical protein